MREIGVTREEKNERERVSIEVTSCGAREEERDGTGEHLAV